MPRPTAFLTLLMALAASPAPAQSAPVTVAVLPFADGGSYGQARETFAALQVAIPALLERQLRAMNGLTAVDRAVVRPLLPDSAGRDRLDAASAAAVGSRAGADFVITGAFMDHYGRLRIDARIIDAHRAQILTVVSNDPALQDRRDLSKMIASLAGGVGRALKVGAPPPVAEVPTEAIVQFGAGLLLEDAGRKADAAERYREALKAAPGFAAAADALARTGGG